MKFQIANNIAETGIVNKTTCQAIKEQAERKKTSDVHKSFDIKI